MPGRNSIPLGSNERFQIFLLPPSPGFSWRTITRSGLLGGCRRWRRWRHVASTKFRVALLVHTEAAFAPGVRGADAAAADVRCAREVNWADVVRFTGNGHAMAVGIAGPARLAFRVGYATSRSTLILTLSATARPYLRAPFLRGAVRVRLALVRVEIGASAALLGRDVVHGAAPSLGLAVPGRPTLVVRLSNCKGLGTWRRLRRLLSTPAPQHEQPDP